MTAGDAPRAIDLTPDERQRGAYNADNLQNALEGLHQDGLLLLKGVVDVAHIDHLRAIMSEDAPKVLAQRAGMFNQGVESNILQNPPTQREDCLFEDVWFNPFVVQIANAYLGARPITNFCTANNALARTKGMRQAVHKDIRFHHPRCPFYFIANFVLSDFSPINGSTEFWLGSHAHTTSQDQIPCTDENKVSYQVVGDPQCFVKEAVYEQRRSIRPPIQPSCAKGDVLIRDLRLWHAGMPNESPDDRIMIAIGYQAPWYPAHRQRMFLPLQHANFFMRHGGQPVEVRANFLDESEMDQLEKNYDFAFNPSVPIPEFNRVEL